MKRSTTSPSIPTLSLSITSVTVTLTEAQKTQLTQLVKSLEVNLDLIDKETNSFKFRLFVAIGSSVSNLQISGIIIWWQYFVKSCFPGGSLTATVDSAATHLLGNMKTVSLNTAAVSSVMAQLVISLDSQPGTAILGNDLTSITMKYNSSKVRLYAATTIKWLLSRTNLPLESLRW